MYIFSEYFEKSESNSKHLLYNSDGNPNPYGLILTSDKHDSLFNQLALSKEHHPIIDSYSLDNMVIDNNNRIWDIEKKSDIDTLKFYIKKIHINPFDIGNRKIVSEFNLNDISLEKEPIDSILYYKYRQAREHK